MWRHYVYIHKRADTGEVFYVGKGSLRKRNKKPVFERAFTTYSRNRYWKNIVAKHGLTVEVVASCLDDDTAQKIEKELIAQYGRKRLANLTDGGDGSAGIIPSESTRRKLSENAKRPRSRQWIESIRNARKNGGNGGVVKKGDRLPQSWRDAISQGQKGPNNYMKGRTGELAPNSRMVIDRKTGTQFVSVSQAADCFGYKLKTLYNWLSGHRSNPTTLEFA